MTTSQTLILERYECTPYECCQTSKIHELLECNQDDLYNFDDLDQVGRSFRRVHLDGESGFEVSNHDHDDSRHVKKLKKKKGKAANRRRRMASPGEEAPPEDGDYEPGTPYDGPLSGDETDFEDEGHGAPEDAAEGDEDDIEIDVVEGESRGSQKGNTQKRSQQSESQVDSQIQEPIL